MNCSTDTCWLCWDFITMKTKNSQGFTLCKLAEYLFQLCLGVYVHITYFTVKCFVLKACVPFIHRSFAFYACPRKGFYGSTSIPSFQHSFVLSPWRHWKWETETTLAIWLHSLFYSLFKRKILWASAWCHVLSLEYASVCLYQSHTNVTVFHIWYLITILHICR